MRRKKSTPSIIDQLRRAIDASGLSRHRICQSTGVDQASMSRFMAGHVGITMGTADSITQVLGLELAGPLLGTTSVKIKARKAGDTCESSSGRIGTRKRAKRGKARTGTLSGSTSAIG